MELTTVAAGGTRLRAALLGLACLLAMVGASPVARAATITVVNYDGAGEGFNDPTPVAPVWGNPGTTLGAQRLNAFQFAANIWGALVDSAAQIRVGAKFDPLSCNSTSAVLGSAGPVSIARDFAGAPVPNTWFPMALANALYGSDLDPGRDDISATFNSSIGTTCPFPRVWYYGLDASPPGSQIDFVAVVLHELGHGLGFLTLVNLGTGAKLAGLDDAFMLNLEDHTTGKRYPVMTDAERVAASTNAGNLHWVGAQVKAASGVLTAGRVGDHVRMFAPSPQQGGSSVSHFDTTLAPNEVMEPVYTGPLHTPGLTLPLFQDIGWATGSPDISVTPSALDFGSAPVGIKSTLDTVTVQNNGTAALAMGVVTLGGANPDQFKAPALADLCSGRRLAPTEACTVGVRFKPTSVGGQSATLLIPSDDPDENPITVTLVGIGQGGEIAVSPAAIDFGTVALGAVSAQTVTVWNDGTADLAISQVTLGGSSPGQYRQPALKNLCSGTTLPPGTSCTVKVKFKPTLPGPLSATLVIPSSDLNESVTTVTLYGMGTP